MNLSSFESKKKKKVKKKAYTKDERESYITGWLPSWRGRGAKGVLFKRVTRAYCGIGGIGGAGNFVEF